MRALVFTHFAVPNYGANLQAYATMRLFKEMGIFADYLNYTPKRLQAAYHGKVLDRQVEKHHQFTQQYLTITPEKLTSMADVHDYVEAGPHEILVTGSDAVFRLEKSGVDDLTFPNPFWLPYQNLNKMRIAVAPSAMGSNIFSIIGKAKREDFQRNISNFDLLTCRDQWTAQQLIRLGCNPKIFLDPVFHLRDIDLEKQKAAYICINFPKKMQGEREYQIKKLAEKRGMEVINLPNPEDVDECEARDPWDWYRLIAESSGYIGVRFHPIVVCISRGIPFVALDQYSRHPLENKRSKTFELVEQFGLQKFHINKLQQKFVSAERLFQLLQENSTVAECAEYINERCSIELDLLRSTICTGVQS